MPSKTTIILTNLNKNDFISEKSYSEYSAQSRKSNMLNTDRIKLEVLNYPGHDDKDKESSSTSDEEYYINNILHWSNLPFLNRIIIILRTEEAANQLYKSLTGSNSIITRLNKGREELIKVSIQENLLSRSKSSDSLIETNNEENNLRVLKKFKNFYNNSNGLNDSEPGSPLDEYEEPQPKKFNVYDDLVRLGIDPSSFNDEDQVKELKELTSNPSPPKSDVTRSRSLTKTLFRPPPTLLINPDIGSSDHSEVPPSPTITLDETF